MEKGWECDETEPSGERQPGAQTQEKENSQDAQGALQGTACSGCWGDGGLGRREEEMGEVISGEQGLHRQGAVLEKRNRAPDKATVGERCQQASDVDRARKAATGQSYTGCAWSLAARARAQHLKARVCDGTLAPHHKNKKQKTLA